MLDFLVQHIESAVQLAPTWGFLLIFIFMTIESSFIPFPSEVVMIPAGFLAARGELTTGIPALDLTIAFVCGTAGALAGAYANYYLALKLGDPFLRKFGKYFFIKPEALDRASEVFVKYGDSTTFICRLIPVIRQLISLPAGLARMPLGRFTFFTGLGAGIWTAILVAAGWGLGKSVGDVSYAELVELGSRQLNENLPWVLTSGVALIVAYTFLSKTIMRRRISMGDAQAQTNRSEAQ